MYHNIEKHPTRKGMYLGYAASGAWRITRSGKGWRAHEDHGTSLVFADTLRVLSDKLEGLNRAYALELRAKRLPNPFASSGA